MGTRAKNPDYEPLPNADKLKWTDHAVAETKSTMMQTDSATGEVYNPKRRYLEQRIQYRLDEEKRAAAEAAAKNK